MVHQLVRRVASLRGVITPVATMSCTSAREAALLAWSATPHQVAQVEVDRIPEQQQLHRRNADDHRQRDAVAAQLRSSRARSPTAGAGSCRRLPATAAGGGDGTLQVRRYGFDMACGRLAGARRSTRHPLRSYVRADGCRSAPRSAPGSSASTRLAWRGCDEREPAACGRPAAHSSAGVPSATSAPRSK